MANPKLSGGTQSEQVEESIPSKVQLDAGCFGRNTVQLLMRSHMVVDGSSQDQECLSRGKALEMSHGFVALFDILVVALYRVVVVLEAVLLTGNGNTIHEPGYAVEIPVEHRAILPELVAHEGDKLPFLRGFMFFSRKNPADLLSNAVFQLLKNSSNSSRVLLLTNFVPRLNFVRLSTAFMLWHVFFPL